jgi:hypothetical protein
MSRYRNFKKYESVNNLTNIISEKEYAFTDDTIDTESVEIIKRVATEYLQRISRTHRMSDDLIATINVVVTPNQDDNSNVGVYVEAANELLQLFSDLNIQ